jgi:hypothetical protein
VPPQRGDSRPIRHHGSIEVLLGHPSDGRPRTREAESEISLEDLAASAPPATELPPFFLWHTAQGRTRTLTLALALALALTLALALALALSSILQPSQAAAPAPTPAL